MTCYLLIFVSMGGMELVHRLLVVAKHTDPYYNLQRQEVREGMVSAHLED